MPRQLHHACEASLPNRHARAKDVVRTGQLRSYPLYHFGCILPTLPGDELQSWIRRLNGPFLFSVLPPRHARHRDGPLWLQMEHEEGSCSNQSTIDTIMM